MSQEPWKLRSDADRCQHDHSWWCGVGGKLCIDCRQMSSATPWSIDDLTKAMEALDAMGPPPTGEGWVSQETLEAIQRQVTFAEDQSRVLWGIHLKIDPTLKPGEFKYDGRILNIFKFVPQTLFCKRCNQEVPRYHDCGGAF